MKAIQYLSITFLVLFQQISAVETEAPTLREHLELPSHITKTFGLSKKDVVKLWGEPDRKSKQKYFYEVGNYRFRLILTFKESKNTQLRYVFEEDEAKDFESFEMLKSQESYKISLYPEHGHQKSRYIKVEVKNEDEYWSLYFHNNSKRRLHYIEWRKLR